MKFKNYEPGKNPYPGPIGPIVMIVCDDESHSGRDENIKAFVKRPDSAWETTQTGRFNQPARDPQEQRLVGDKLAPLKLGRILGYAPHNGPGFAPRDQLAARDRALARERSLASAGERVRYKFRCGLCGTSGEVSIRAEKLYSIFDTLLQDRDFDEYNLTLKDLHEIADLQGH